MRVTVIPIVVSALETIPKGLEISRRFKTVKDHNIDEIGQNSQKSPENLRRLSVTKTPVNDYQLTLVWKSHRVK